MNTISNIQYGVAIRNRFYGGLTMNKQDRRSKRTEQALLSALGQLLQHKQLWEITVSELVQLAGVHRSTFYTHYTDIYALYKTAEDRFFSLFQEVIRTSDAHDYRDIFHSILHYMDENRAATAIFFGDNADPSFRKRFIDFSTEQYLAISAYEDQVTAIPPRWKTLAAYHVGGFVSLIFDWIRSGFATPTEELTELCIDLDLHMRDLRHKELGNANA